MCGKAVGRPDGQAIASYPAADGAGKLPWLAGIDTAQDAMNGIWPSTPTRSNGWRPRTQSAWPSCDGGVIASKGPMSRRGLTLTACTEPLQKAAIIRSVRKRGDKASVQSVVLGTSGRASRPHSRTNPSYGHMYRTWEPDGRRQRKTVLAEGGCPARPFWDAARWSSRRCCLRRSCCPAGASCWY